MAVKSSVSPNPSTALLLATDERVFNEAGGKLKFIAVQNITMAE